MKILRQQDFEETLWEALFIRAMGPATRLVMQEQDHPTVSDIVDRAAGLADGFINKIDVSRELNLP